MLEEVLEQTRTALTFAIIQYNAIGPYQKTL